VYLWHDLIDVDGVKQQKVGIRKLFVLSIALTLALCGCHTINTAVSWSATGGSRADGTVRLSYEYGIMEKPKINETEAIDLATARCKVWGYSGAEAFGGLTHQCGVVDGQIDCDHTRVTKEFQCTGTGNKEPETK
jgi:hypothetical protein